MCVLRRLTGLVLLAFLTTVGCDVNQPLQVDESMAEVRFTAPTATGPARTYNVWTMYEDSDRDGLPDDGDGDGQGDTYPWCELTDASLWRPPVSIPWFHSLEITVTRSVDNSKERVTNDASLEIDGNLTFYDSVVEAATLAEKPPITLGSRRFVFDNDGQFGPSTRLTAAHQRVASGTSNPLSDIGGADGQYGHERGLCSRYYPGPPTIGGGPGVFGVVLKKGDNMVVGARRGTGVAQMQYRDTAGVLKPLFPPPGASVESELTIDGSPIAIDTGNTGSGIQFGSSISYTYTAR